MAIYQGLNLLAGAGTSPYIDENGNWTVNGVVLGPVSPTKLMSDEFQALIRDGKVDPGVAYYVIDGTPILYPNVQLKASGWVKTASTESFTYTIETRKIKTTDLVHIDIANSLGLTDYVNQLVMLQKARIQRIQLNGTNVLLYGTGICPTKDLLVDISAIRTYVDTL